jgi:nondiscriminating glutamyl-tRNA synthetase
MDGQKLSKRSRGQAFLVNEYKEKGVLSEALVNYVVLFGWNPNWHSDILSMNDLIEKVLPPCFVLISFLWMG